jgi:hypothetical protein
MDKQPETIFFNVFVSFWREVVFSLQIFISLFHEDTEKHVTYISQEEVLRVIEIIMPFYTAFYFEESALRNVIKIYV